MTCLENEEWTSRRNALSMLTTVVEYFPVVQEQHLSLRKLVEKVRGAARSSAFRGDESDVQRRGECDHCLSRGFPCHPTSSASTDLP